MSCWYWGCSRTAFDNLERYKFKPVYAHGSLSDVFDDPLKIVIAITQRTVHKDSIGVQ